MAGKPSTATHTTNPSSSSSSTANTQSSDVDDDESDEAMGDIDDDDCEEERGGGMPHAGPHAHARALPMHGEEVCTTRARDGAVEARRAVEAGGADGMFISTPQIHQTQSQCVPLPVRSQMQTPCGPSLGAGGDDDDVADYEEYDDDDEDVL